MNIKALSTYERMLEKKQKIDPAELLAGWREAAERADRWGSDWSNESIRADHLADLVQTIINNLLIPMCKNPDVFSTVGIRDWLLQRMLECKQVTFEVKR